MTYTGKIILAGLAALGLVAASTAAMAEPARSTVALNVRSGPGINYNVVSVLRPNERVEVTECVSNGWCRIDHAGPDGWVSSNYLAEVRGGASGGSSGGSSGTECDFGVSIGSDGPDIDINCGGGSSGGGSGGDDGSGDDGSDTPDAGACFYTAGGFSGAELCRGPAVLNTLDSTFDNNIASLRIQGDVRVQLCTNTNLSGSCGVVDESDGSLPAGIRDQASSLVVFEGGSPSSGGGDDGDDGASGPPSTYSTGPIDLQQTYLADLDNGNVTSSGADIWYEAETATEKYITPRNGAGIAVGDGSNRGYSGCAAASYSSARVPLDEIPVGTYVCVRTNQNRISSFRVNDFTGTTMNLGYTTWSN